MPTIPCLLVYRTLILFGMAMGQLKALTLLDSLTARSSHVIQVQSMKIKPNVPSRNLRKAFWKQINMAGTLLTPYLFFLLMMWTGTGGEVAILQPWPTMRTKATCSWWLSKKWERTWAPGGITESSSYWLLRPGFLGAGDNINLPMVRFCYLQLNACLMGPPHGLCIFEHIRRCISLMIKPFWVGFSCAHPWKQPNEYLCFVGSWLLMSWVLQWVDFW